MNGLIAVTAMSLEGLDAKVDPRFGRAGGFVLVQAEKMEVVDNVPNESVQAAHGAGTGSAALMAARGVARVISGRFGPKAYEALDRMGIEMWIAPEGLTVREAVEQLAEGKLERMRVKVFR